MISHLVPKRRGIGGSIANPTRICDHEPFLSERADPLGEAELSKSDISRVDRERSES